MSTILRQIMNVLRVLNKTAILTEWVSMAVVYFVNYGICYI